MAFITHVTRQFGGLINSQSAARRLMLLLIVAAAAGAMIWLSLRAHTGGYTVLYSGLRSADAGEAAAKLRPLGIDVRVTDGGTTIRVPRNRADEAAVTLAMEGIPSSGVVGYELMDRNSLGQSKFQQDKNYHRMREGELVRTLLSIREIERARVHLALPENTLFVKDAQDPTASVVIKTRSGEHLNERQINGIVHLVSHSVEGLRPENVTVIDHLGNMLNANPKGETADSSLSQQTFKMQYEDLLKSRIETMLENVIGKGKVAARVQADFNYSTLRSVKEVFNPNDQEQIVKSQKSLMENKEDGAKLAGAAGGGGPKGPAGSSSALPPGSPGGPSGQAMTGGGQPATRNDMTTEYAVSSERSESSDLMPKPTRVTVAVLIDGMYDEAAGENGKKEMKYRPRPPEELSELEELIKATIGFTANETRQDVVTVKCAPFKIEEMTDLESPRISYQTRKMIETGVEWFIVGLISLLMILMVLRPAVNSIVVSPAPVRRAALPGGMGTGAAGDYHPSASGGVPTEAPSRSGKSKKGEVRMNKSEIALDSVEIPPEIAADPEATKMYRMQRMAVERAKLSQAEASEVHQEVVNTAKNDPKKTVSLLRQWMDEA